MIKLSTRNKALSCWGIDIWLSSSLLLRSLSVTDYRTLHITLFHLRQHYPRMSRIRLIWVIGLGVRGLLSCIYFRRFTIKLLVQFPHTAKLTLSILLEGGRDCTARDTKRAADLLMSLTSIAIKRICNITLAQGEPGPCISKNWIAEHWGWMVATFMAYKVWRFKMYIEMYIEMYIISRISITLYYLQVVLS